MTPPRSTDVLHFATAAKRLGAAARARGLVVPAFRAPTRIPGTNRTVRRYPGGAVVSVNLRDRDEKEWISDLVEGILVVNRTDDNEHRAALLEAVDFS